MGGEWIFKPGIVYITIQRAHSQAGECNIAIQKNKFQTGEGFFAIPIHLIFQKAHGRIAIN